MRVDKREFASWTVVNFRLSTLILGVFSTHMSCLNENKSCVGIDEI